MFLARLKSPIWKSTESTTGVWPTGHDGEAPTVLLQQAAPLRSSCGIQGAASFRYEPPCEAIFDNHARVLYAREVLHAFWNGANLSKLLVARDGIEPPTPAFSGPPTESRKWF